MPRTVSADQSMSDDELSEIIFTKDQTDWYLMAKATGETDKSVTLTLHAQVRRFQRGFDISE
jgi:hypothetical protein